jgi:heparosan-N-sulfate-glucuronate 5-epimerase
MPRRQFTTISISLLFIALLAGSALGVFGLEPVASVSSSKIPVPKLKLDSSGIPITDYGNVTGIYIGPQRNPITIAHKAIDYFNSFEKNKDTNSKQLFLNTANWFVGNTLPHGNYSILEYKFPWPQYQLKAPWQSGMAQAQALGILARAYNITHEIKYLNTSKMLLNSFFVEVKDGGVTYKSPTNGWWYEEYAADNHDRVISRALNGMIFSVLGIYDYYKYTKDPEAKYLFDKGILALKNNLALYDNNGDSFYDILKTPANQNYHKTHVKLLQQLYDITGESTFEGYHDRWSTRVK